jgi:hypothetical protein
VRLTEVTNLQAVVLVLPGLSSDRAWEFQADGACRVGAGRAVQQEAPEAEAGAERD